ncbi:MAG: hypothetical protein JWM09_920 [Francisellaceae bacterium]|nr:hypothetical protein [Francisellaceae bacterium]
MSKYIFDKGVMKINPQYTAQQAQAGNPSSLSRPNESLAIVSSMNDIQNAATLQEQVTGQPMQLAESTQSSLEIMQDKEYLAGFKASQPFEEGALVDRLSNYFIRYEVPIGLVNKLLALPTYNLNFIIDDSGSMDALSDTDISMANDYTKNKKSFMPNASSANNKLTRWEEAEDRLHTMMDILSCLPVPNITIRFLNRQDVINLQAGGSPDEFVQRARIAIANAFKTRPRGCTPIYNALTKAFESPEIQTMHYLFTDGLPSDQNGQSTQAEIDKVTSLVMHRKNPEFNPLTFISCTNDDESTKWMKKIEERGPFISELDDFNDERDEILHDQGKGLPYSKGVWLISQLVAAICPDDLDALDEDAPFTKCSLDNFLGRKTTIQEYDYYFNAHPKASEYHQAIQEFRREDLLAKDITLVQAKKAQKANKQDLGNNYNSTTTQYNQFYQQYSNNNAFQQPSVSSQASVLNYQYQTLPQTNQMQQNQPKSNSSSIKSKLSNLFK